MLIYSSTLFLNTRHPTRSHKSLLLLAIKVDEKVVTEPSTDVIESQLLVEFINLCQVLGIEFALTSES